MKNLMRVDRWNLLILSCGVPNIQMSRIWKNPIIIPAWVDVSLEWNTVSVKGKEWNLSFDVPTEVTVSMDEWKLVFAISDDAYKNLWGTSRAICANMITWVDAWYEKKLLVLWVWYAAQIQWSTLILSLGLSHKVEYTIPEWLNVVVDKSPAWDILIVIRGCDKQLVWQSAAVIRSYRKPDVYKWKWIRYIDEYIKLKPTKSVKK